MELLPARRHRRRGQARHQRVRLHRDRRLASLAVHLGSGVRRPPLADGATGARLGARACAATTAPCCGHARADDRPWDYALLTGSSSIAHALRCGSQSCRVDQRATTRLDRRGRSPEPADQRAPASLRAEGSLGDGLVLPRAVRLPHRRAGQDPHGRRLERVRHGAPRHSLRQRRAVDHRIGDRRMRHRARGDRRPGDGDRSARAGLVCTDATTARTTPASCIPPRCASRSTRSPRTPAPRSSSPPTRSTLRRPASDVFVPRCYD